MISTRTYIRRYHIDSLSGEGGSRSPITADLPVAIRKLAGMVMVEDGTGSRRNGLIAGLRNGMFSGILLLLCVSLMHPKPIQVQHADLLAAR